MSPTVLAQVLNLASYPVAIRFVDAAPAGVPHVTTTEPANCGYWRRAAAGEVFYTVADDHKRCPATEVRWRAANATIRSWTTVGMWHGRIICDDRFAYHPQRR
jgi:hypothetical protein